MSPAAWTLIRFYRTGVAWWAGVFTVALLPIGLVGRYAEPEGSLWVHVIGEPVRWVLLVMGLLAAPSLFRVMVAHGVTRRVFASASAVAIALFAVAVAVFTAVGFLVERALSDDPPAGLTRTHLFESTGQVHLVLAEYALVSAAYLVSGWLIGVGFQRHWLAGIGLIPMALLPAAGMPFALGTQSRIYLPDLPLGVALLVAAAMVVLGLLAGRWLLHTAPIKPKKS